MRSITINMTRGKSYEAGNSKVQSNIIQDDIPFDVTNMANRIFVKASFFNQPLRNFDQDHV